MSCHWLTCLYLYLASPRTYGFNARPCSIFCHTKCKECCHISSTAFIMRLQLSPGIVEGSRDVNIKCDVSTLGAKTGPEDLSNWWFVVDRDWFEPRGELIPQIILLLARKVM